MENLNLEQNLKLYIQQTVNKHRFLHKAADELGISSSTLYRKMKKYGIKHDKGNNKSNWVEPLI